MTTLTVRQLLIFVYIVSFVTLIIGIATEPQNFNVNSSSRAKAYAAFQVIGVVSLGVVIILEILSAFTSAVKDNRTVQLISTVFMVIACVSTVIACAVYSAYHFPYGWTVAACTLVIEALFIFIVTHMWIH